MGENSRAPLGHWAFQTPGPLLNQPTNKGLRCPIWKGCWSNSGSSHGPPSLCRTEQNFARKLETARTPRKHTRKTRGRCEMLQLCFFVQGKCIRLIPEQFQGTRQRCRWGCASAHTHKLSQMNGKRSKRTHKGTKENGHQPQMTSSGNGTHPGACRPPPCCAHASSVKRTKNAARKRTQARRLMGIDLQRLSRRILLVELGFNRQR